MITFKQLQLHILDSSRSIIGEIQPKCKEGYQFFIQLNVEEYRAFS